jgi:hypothetical protein
MYKNLKIVEKIFDVRISNTYFRVAPVNKKYGLVGVRPPK